jgi:hypothetical protein
MRHPSAILFIALVANALWSCSYFDSGTPWSGGPYALKWIDLPNEVWLEYRRPDGSSDIRIDPRVFAVTYSPWLIAPAPGGNCFGGNVPTTAAQCKNGGWMTSTRPDGSTFKNQGDCIQYVNTGK